MMVALGRFQHCLLLGLCIVLVLQGRCQSFSVANAVGHHRFARESPSTLLSSPTNESLETESLEQKPAQKQKSQILFREMCAEAIGTFLIVQLGTGAVMAAVFDDALVGLFQIASVWIIAVTIAIATTGPISGAHLNPAISISFACLRPASFSATKVLPYVAAQLVGATLGSSVNLLMYGKRILEFEAANKIVRGSVESIASAKAFGEYFVDPISAGLAFFVEAFGTGILSFVIYALTNPNNDTQKNKVYIPPLIGMTVGALIATLAPLTQAGFNPARDFGPRLVAFLAGWKKVAFKGWWVYVFAPIVGALTGGFIADRVLYQEDVDSS